MMMPHAKNAKDAKVDAAAPRPQFLVPLSPQRGEGLGVRGGLVEPCSRGGSLTTFPPLTPA